MEKWLIFCLNILFATSCKDNRPIKGQERIDCERAELLYEQKGGQGSNRSQSYLDSAISICPTFSKGYREISVPYLKRGDYSTWLQYLDKAINHDPESYLGIRAWCKTKFLHDYRGALKDFKTWDTILYSGSRTVADNSMYSWMALCYAGLADMPSALGCIDRSIKEAIRDFGSDWVGLYDYFYRGNIKRELNDLEGALTDFNSQIRLTDKVADVYYYKGVVLLQLGRRQEAKANILKAKSLFSEGKHMHDPYIEIPWQIWKEDIDAELLTL
ncbi:MAG: tetratricopeptide repeat protein [Olivibacter sp.]|nr:tetratricopeptide repeat protein [Olivibacter sp. UJ_SKK_5.1]